jgi:hypothetical protein
MYDGFIVKLLLHPLPYAGFYVQGRATFGAIPAADVTNWIEADGDLDMPTLWWLFRAKLVWTRSGNARV